MVAVVVVIPAAIATKPLLCQTQIFWILFQRDQLQRIVAVGLQSANRHLCEPKLKLSSTEYDSINHFNNSPEEGLCREVKSRNGGS